MKLAAYICIALFALIGCTTQPIPQRDEIVAHIRLVDHIDYKPGYHAMGLSRCANGVCVVQVLRDEYPDCILHEIRHGFEGDWHPGRETTEDC